MATSTQSSVFKKLSYIDDIKKQIVSSGGTIIHTRDNIIVASEISEAQYRELLQSPYITKLDVLPLKRYANEGISYEKSDIISELQEQDQINIEIKNTNV